MGKLMFMDETYSSTVDNCTGLHYDNASSELDAKNVQDAIDEVNDKVINLTEQTEENSTEIEKKINKTSIANNLTTTQEGFVLDARQGDVLNNHLSQLSNPNLLINADFQVWQRGTSFNTIVAEAFRYNADRWCHYTNVASRVIRKVTNGIYTEANLFQFLEKRLETGVSYVLSACVNGEIYTLNIIGGTQDTTSSIRLRYLVGTNFDRIGITFNSSTEGFTSMTVNWVKLEKGTVRTPFVPRTHAEELQMCQRYYYVLPLANYNGFAGSGGTVWLFIEQLLNMRTKPSASTDISTVYVVSLGSRHTFSISSPAINIEENSVGLNLVSPTEINRPVGVYWKSASGESIKLDAEIY